MLKRDPLGTLLAGAILFGVVVTTAVCYWYLQSTRQHSRMQLEAAVINRERNAAQQLALEAVEYGKRDPSILQVLQKAGILKVSTNQESGTR